MRTLPIGKSNIKNRISPILLSSSLKYILYLVAIHLALVIMVFNQLQGYKYMVFVGEAALMLSVYIAYRIFRSLISPLRLLARGADALADQDFTVKLMPTGSLEMDRIVNIYNRMIDQLRDERVSSRQQEEFLERLLAAAEIGVVILDFDGEVESMNNWMEKLCREELFNTAVLEPSLHLRPRPNNAAAIDTFTGPGNRRYHVERATFVDRGFERGFLVIQDVTSEIMAAEREAYGKVIRMMAHEVNNSNAAVVSVLRSLLEAATEEEEGLEQLSKDYLPAVINRAENMTSFMRHFAKVVRLPPPDKKRIDLNAMLHRTGEVMEVVLREKNIDLRYDLHANEVWVEADAAQLEQVVVNALTNARQSIGQDGNIRISSSAFPNKFVIADDGPGIPEEVANKIFTPFFSTKPSGQGVGLTLTRDILEAHDASYQLKTEEDGWTRLRVTF